jgi:hypothetical protein
MPNGKVGHPPRIRKAKNLPLINADDTDRKGKTFTAETPRRGEENLCRRSTADKQEIANHRDGQLNARA